MINTSEKTEHYQCSSNGYGIFQDLIRLRLPSIWTVIRVLSCPYRRAGSFVKTAAYTGHLL